MERDLGALIASFVGPAQPKAAPEELATLYEVNLASEFAWVNFVRETDFAQDLDKIVRPEGASCILFGVDDALFIRGFQLDAAWRTLQLEPTVAAFHLKLARGMTFCQPANRPMREPGEENFKSAENGVVWTFPLGVGTLDWSYPWDLCGSMYRRSDVLRMLSTLAPEERSHPNLLEMNGARQVSSFFGHSRRAACFAGPQIMVVVTVNRVQDLYTNAVYSNEATNDGRCLLHNHKSNDVIEDATSEEETMQDFNPLFESHQFALEAFAAQTFDRVHIGFFALQERCDATILLPFRNAAGHIALALESICSQDCLLTVKSKSSQETIRLELLLIDDHSEDDGAQLVRTILSERVNSLDLGPSFSWRIIQSSGRGVAAALNTGLALARGRNLVRMDADDVTSAQRLRLQLSALQARPSLDVIGTGAFLVRNETVQQACSFENFNQTLLRTASTPSGTAYLRWRLFFACDIVHPTVAMRRKVLLHMRGYNEEVKAEDYHLWLRCSEAGYELDNVPEVLHALRISSSSVSGRKGVEEHREIHMATAREAWVRARLLPADLSSDAFRALLFGMSAPDVTSAKSLITALEALEKLVSSGRTDERITTETSDRIKILATLIDDADLWTYLAAERGLSRLDCMRAIASHS
ncbi:Chondroitin polymerase [Hondaea fermentalgiana]|uniref:Chondroitin polymerase n=1 Tax=Hondaea fermentalgiana TaxID=2315210 RepID=A0A2R5G4B4_9STRA|nr:Chondroitin polymerase [Hondaea fermentalgiana]|eukprot:GBG25395.1 Chondroitin polymerase [Hondaea fermentalgiana]